jgi:hypothetical protein
VSDIAATNRLARGSRSSERGVRNVVSQLWRAEPTVPLRYTPVDDTKLQRFDHPQGADNLNLLDPRAGPAATRRRRSRPSASIRLC